MKPDIEYVYNKLKQLRFEFKEADRKLFPKEYKFDYGLDRYVRVDGNDLYISKDTFKPLEEELEYADKMHNLEEQLGCPLEVREQALKQGYIFVEWNGKDGLEKEKITHIAYDNECKEFLFKRYVETTNGCLACEMNIPISHYKKTWWLKEDKSE